MIEFGPNPPSRREEDFPKTTTIPEGWTTEALAPAAASESKQSAAEAESTRPAPVVNDEGLFTRQLEPFPQTKTFPTGWDLSAL